MRKMFKMFGRTPLVAAVLAAGALAAGSAAASNLYQEQVHADSFGNLVIYSPAGYKRIVVGQGYLAEALKAAQAEVAEPRHDDKYRHPGKHHHHYHHHHCNRQPVLLHGRSYMYGLPDHVVPTPAGACY